MANIGVFCGSSTTKQAYHRQAWQAGKDIATSGHTIIYGGSSKGLMGEMARSALNHGGKVEGVIPIPLKSKEPPQKGVILHTCQTLDERLTFFRNNCDAYVVLAGGTGTAEELMHMLNAMAFSIWNKPEVEIAMPPKPLALVRSPSTKPLWHFLQTGMNINLVEKRLAPYMACEPWPKLHTWLSQALNVTTHAA